MTADQEGDESAEVDTPEVEKCCCVCNSTEDLKRCSKCKSTIYCSKSCQKSHLPHHSEYCAAIMDLEELEKDKLYRGRSVRQSQVDFRTKKKLLKLVGVKPMLRCLLEGKEFEMLWDTGSMVSLVDRRWIEEHFPEITIHPVSEFMEEELSVRAANATSIQLDGVIVLELCLEEGGESVLIPVVVTAEDLIEPILGYNVIEHLILEKEKTQEQRKLLQSALSGGRSFSVDALAVVMKEKAENPDFLTEVKSSQTVNIPAGHRVKMRCRVKAQSSDEEQTVYFDPILSADGTEDRLVFSETVSTLKRGRTNYVTVDVMNMTKEDRVLKKGEVLGSMHSVSAVIPMTRLFDVGGNKGEESKKEGETEKPLAEGVSVDVGGVEGKQEEDAVEDGTKMKWNLSHLEKDKREMLEKVLNKNEDIFSVGDLDIGEVKDFKMELNVVDNTPVKAAYRKVPPHLYTEVRNYVEDMKTNGWIRESFSSYSSPIVCARKKNGGLRLCVDYRKLNAKTLSDAQPIPRIQDILDSLGGSKFFTTLDMSKAYHQGFMDEKSRHLTAFITPWALYEWIRIPFGLRNAPPAFQRYMNQMLADYKGVLCEPYLDDVLCHSSEFEQHVTDVDKVLTRLREKGIKLRAEKCEFAKKEVRYLGRLISEEGYRPDPKDTKSLEKFRSPPQNIGELRKLLGFLGYFRTYVQAFSQRVKPLYDLLKGKVTRKVGKGKGDGKTGQQYNSREKITWGEEQQKVLDELIDTLMSPPVIAFPRFDSPFFLNTDASNQGLGAVLYQNQDGVDRVISYASRTLSEAEQNYHLHSGKLEFLALKWAVCQRFSDYLQFGTHPFQVFTDNNPLTYVLTTAKLNAVGLRWVNELADYNFTIHYKPGKNNVDADYLSRRPLDIEELRASCTESVDPQSMNAVMSGVKEAEHVVSAAIRVENLELKADAEVVPISREKLKSEQMNDEVVGPVYKAVVTGVRPNRKGWSELNSESRVLMRSFAKLKVSGDGVLVRETAKFRQIVLPSCFHELIYDELHKKMGHLSAEKVTELAQQRVYWPRMAENIKSFITKKCRCVVNKQPNVKPRAPLHPIEAQFPFEMISIDYIELDKCKGGFRYALVVIDNFTRFCQIYATRNKSSKAAAEHLFNNFILNFGSPKRIHHDRGPEWNNKLFAELHKMAGIKASNTTPYCPQGNPHAERTNRTFVNMLKAMSQKETADWKKHLPKLAFAINSTKCKTTNFSPYFLLYGREPLLPIDQIFRGVDEPESDRVICHEQFAKDWEKSMKNAFEVARENIHKSAVYNKKYFDKRANTVDLEVGDIVLVRNLREKVGKPKMHSWYEENLFKVMEQKEGIPVFTVKNIKKSKDVRVLHRNKLLKVNDMPLDVFEESGETKRTTQVGKKKRDKKSAPKQQQQVGEGTHSGSDSDEDILVVVERRSAEVEEQSEPVDQGDLEAEVVEDITVPLADVSGGVEFDQAGGPGVDSADGNLDSDRSSDHSDPSDSVSNNHSEEESSNSEGDAEICESDDDVGESSSSTEEEGEVSESDTPPVRRSSRQRIPKRIQTYNKLGGELEIEEIT